MSLMKQMILLLMDELDSSDEDYIVDNLVSLYILRYIQDEEKKKKKKKYIHSSYLTNFYRKLSLTDKRKIYIVMPRAVLPIPQKDSFHDILASKNDRALICCTGFDYSSFKWLLDRLQEPYDRLRTDGKGRLTHTEIGRVYGGKRYLETSKCLGLVLCWTRSRGSVWPLSVIFGVTQPSFSRYLNLGRKILLHVLRDDTMACVRLLIKNEI